ncbi:MAG: hypothetical protein K2X11_01655 [Acetobacteraceae bacterium]|nr:hypothetical protein [Acetobacteraceae bacterium]
MAWLLEALLLLAPLLAYVAWWRLTGRQAELRPSARLVGLLAAGIGCAMIGALLYGFSRGIDRTERYQPAQLRDGEVTPGRGVARP